jgi:hypothetical protein
LAELLRELRAREASLLAEAWARAAEMLPTRLDCGGVRLVVLPIGLDFRTERDTVYMDPIAAVALGLDGIGRILAHELHHIARYRLTGQNLTLMTPDPLDARATVRGVFGEWATWLEAEGIADCVSNVTQIDVRALRGIVEARRRQMADYAGLLSQALKRIRDESAKRTVALPELELLRGELRSLAHPIGARMAETILSTEGRAALVGCVGRPANFLRQYARHGPAGGAVEIEETLFDWVEAT